jgi:DNA-binding transcriptional LysR family regulator
MEIQQLKAFLAVAKSGNFTRAAETVFRTQPSVTVAVRQLEREMGVRLFERHGRRTLLTSEGAALAQAARPVLSGWDSLKDAVNVTAQGGRSRGHVRIGAGDPAMLYFLPKIVMTIRRKHPEVRISLFGQRRDQTLEMLKAGELDFGLRSLESAPSWAYYRQNLTYERMVIAAKGHPVGKLKKMTLGDVASYPLLMGDPVSRTRRIVEGKLSAAGLTWGMGIQAGGWESLKTYARLGLGIAVVPAICLSDEDRQTMTVKSAGHLFGFDKYGVVTRRGAVLSPAAKMAIKLVDPEYRTAD